jgi:hypothetical protein
MASDIASEQQALVSYELIRWLSASCPEHERFSPDCLACLTVPQACPAHPKTNGTFPGFDLDCAACKATRPGFETVMVAGQQVMSAEEAVRTFGIPHVRLAGGRVLRVGLDLLRRTR